MSNYLYAGSSPQYEPEVLTGIARLGAALGHDIYQIDQDDDEIEHSAKFKRLPKHMTSDSTPDASFCS